LEIKDYIVSIDATGCQLEIAEQIIRQKGDYLLVLKVNQGNLHEEVKVFSQQLKNIHLKNLGYDFQEDIDAGHGRIEVRRACILDF